MYYQSRRGDIVLVAPCLNVAEAGKAVAVEGYDGLGFFHLCSQIFVGTLCDTRSAHLGSLFDGCQDGVYILLVSGIGHYYINLFVHYLIVFISLRSLYRG